MTDIENLKTKIENMNIDRAMHPNEKHYIFANGFSLEKQKLAEINGRYRAKAVCDKMQKEHGFINLSFGHEKASESDL